MQKDGAPDAIDWLSISLRWITLVGLSASSIGNIEALFPIRLTILAFAIWNLALTVLSGLHGRIRGLRLPSVLLDLLIANLLFYLSGALEGDLVWSGILPLLSAALYLDRRRTLGMTLVIIVSQGVQVFFFYSTLVALLFMGVMTVLYTGVGITINGLSQQVAALAQRREHERAEVQRSEEEKERQQRRALYRLISTLSATLNYQRVLDTALDLSASILASSSDFTEPLVSAFLFFSEEGSKVPLLQVAAARRLTKADWRIQLPGTSGLIGRTIHNGEPCLTKDVPRDPELGRIVALRACQSAYCIPLRRGLDTYGVLLFAHKDSEYFTQERREILDIVGNQVVVAIHNACLYRDLEAEKEHLLEVQEEARRKLARDLHDGPAQSIAALAMRVNLARRLLERDVKATAEELFKIEDLARRTAKEIRHMLFTLRPLVLESKGLIPALETMAAKMHEMFNQEVILQVDPDVIPLLNGNKQAVIFSIAEEAISNARKHAQAEHIWVRLQNLQDGYAVLEVEDDGIGFDPEEAEANYDLRGGLGLINMRERAELVHGVLTLASQLGRGTRVQVILPLTEQAMERLHHSR